MFHFKSSSELDGLSEAGTVYIGVHQPQQFTSADLIWFN